MLRCWIEVGEQRAPYTTETLTIPAGAGSHFQQFLPFAGQIEVPTKSVVSEVCENDTKAAGGS